MNSLFPILKGAVTLLVIFLLHSIIAYITPWPFHLVNVIYIYLVWLVINNHKNKALWLALLFGFLTELFSGEIFGVHIATLILSIMITGFAVQTIFSNLSWYMILVIGMLSTFVYRLSYVFLVYTSHLFKGLSVTSVYIIDSVLVELAVNTMLLLLIYLFSVFFNRRTGPKYI